MRSMFSAATPSSFGEVDMTDQPSAPKATGARGFPLLAAILLTAVVYSLSIYANLSFAVTNQASLKYFPPYKSYVNANQNGHLGAEYFLIGKSLVKGEGFANPFPIQTGPTAWMPPVYPFLLAPLIWMSNGDKDFVMAVIVFLQVFVLLGTGLMVLMLMQQTGRFVGALVALPFFIFLALVCNFHLAFQFTHDCWLVMLALDLVIAGFCWFAPLDNRGRAIVWGVVGGFVALINPVVAFAWGIFSCMLGISKRAWVPLGLAVLVAGLVVTPWIVRNFLVFGRLIPVKSNLAYELYQSQVLQADGDGLLKSSTFGTHPYAAASRERQEYKQMGEIPFLEKKKKQFWDAVWADPEDFADRVAMRFLGATLWYQPFDRSEATRRPYVCWMCRLAYPLPFLGMLLLIFTGISDRLHWAQLAVIAVYLLYLMPYAVVSYYDRYAFPLIGAKVLLVVWAFDRLLGFLPRRRTQSTQQTRSRPAAAPARKSKVVPATH